MTSNLVLRPFYRTLFTLHGVLLIGLITACSTSQNGSIVAPRLQSEKKVGDLVHVNSVLIAPIKIEDHSLAGERASDVSRAIVQAVTEELTMEVVDGTKNSNARAAAKSPALAADAILQITLHRYTERQGSRIGASQPAEVYADFILQSSRTELELWRASFRVKDEALSDNLLRIKDKIKDKGTFRTARDLLLSGVRDACRNLGEKRLEQFTAN
jgi:hypothetical protein